MSIGSISGLPASFWKRSLMAPKLPPWVSTYGDFCRHTVLTSLLGGLEHGAHAADAGAHYNHVGVNGLGDVGDGGGAVAPGAGLGLGGLVGNGGGGQARDGGGSGNGGGAGDELPTVEFHGDPLVSCRDVARGGACRVGAARTAQAGGPRV